ncbi:MAG: serine hydrolase, partial [Candidatus Sericytochromatia bacterium]
MAQAAGKVAVACHHLRTGERWALGDAVFPAASLIKVHLAIAAYRAAEHGALDLEETVTVPPLAADDEAEFDNLGLAPAGTRFTWRKILDRMLTESDNAATNLVIDRLGMGAIEGLVERLGLTGTALRRRMLDVAAREAGHENTTTAADMERLLTGLAAGELLSAAHTQELLGLLGQQRDRDKLAAGLPRGAAFAHKTGELPGDRHDAGLVDGRWVVVALAEGGAEADGLLARIAEVLAAHFRAAEHAFDRVASWLADERTRLIPDP